ncbi:MAG: hypothetical protein V9E99_03510 [Microthrixaceae bacterium]|jgi:hypothetical protein|nr:hypothetical protein [Microthrixaceae bacterium]HMT25519.1 hypothetical protein [Microthrixaceae bacterium]HMT61754.1 hypothetical protein [Microthrixaceae bacterium]
MRLAIHVVRLICEVLRFSIATRRLSLLIVVLLGLALVGLALTAQTVAPLAVYPFA